ncbi:unnamed protein product, partial [Brachionus calyciflorus]
ENISFSDGVGPINNLASSLFKQVEVKLNGNSVEPTNNGYAYKAYISDWHNPRIDRKVLS